MPGNFDFLKERFPRLASYGEWAEQCHSTGDEESCGSNVRKILESVIWAYLNFNGLDMPRKDGRENLAAGIDTLYEKNIIGQYMCDKLNGLRREGNRNAHSFEDPRTPVQSVPKQQEQSQMFLRDVWDVCRDFFNTYKEEAVTEREFYEEHEGGIVEGRVSGVASNALFVTLWESKGKIKKRIDGRAHVNEITWKRNALTSEKDILRFYKKGDRIKARVIGINEQGRIALSVRQGQGDPYWKDIDKRYSAGQDVNVRVLRLDNTGAFVELEEGIEGFVPVSEPGSNSVEKAGNVLQAGQEITARIIDIDPEQGRISLALKAPEEERKQEQEKEKEREKKAPNVLYRQGIEYQNGKKNAQAAECFLEAARQGHAGAQYRTGDVFEQGQGVRRDRKQAAEWYGRAAEQGHAAAQCRLGIMYEEGRGVGKDEKKAAELYGRSAAQGYKTASYRLGVMYEEGRGVEKDEKKAAEYFTEASERGHRTAQYRLGVMYEEGRGVGKDIQRAAELYERAAAQKYARAAEALERMSQPHEPEGQAAAKTAHSPFEGDTVKNQDDPAVLYKQGVEHEKRQDYGQALECFRRAAEQGYRAAQYALGFMYRQGQGIEKNDEQAFIWYSRAASQGHAGAMYNLGVMYARGQGAGKDDTQAVEWYHRAASQGYPAAQYAMGFMYKQGRGVEKDDAQAAEWYRRAAAQEYEPARRALESMGLSV